MLQILIGFWMILFNQEIISLPDVISNTVVQEREAQFPGGLPAWQKFLVNNLNSDVPIANHAPRGMYTVLVKFIIDKNGIVIDVQPENDPGYGMAAEAVKCIKKSPRWIPAKKNGKPVAAYKMQPITFLVE